MNLKVLKISPEQKATQLYDDFVDTFYELEAKQDIQLDHELIDEEAVECGLICINEIIASIIKLHPIEYWQKVKKELQKKIIL